CLRTAARDAPLTVFGDMVWREAAPEATDLRPEVDYYGPLRHIYAQAAACLNVTSLLLPTGLNQRHFDVWAAGGLLITDATPGLSLFPEELCRETRFRWPEEIESIFHRLTTDKSHCADLSREWRKLILAEHTYRHRMERLLNWLELEKASS
ncbi:glycosyltransferase, partial [Desulfocurvibacter africanus]|uniref:glycosyltransferase n=1 Tax=Desulfocurvibacter africanus TaxID=873 RepID=UPI002FDA3DEF